MKPEEWHAERLKNAQPLIGHKTISVVGSNKMIIAAVVVGGGVIFYVSNLEEVPQTGRRRFNCYSEEAAEKQGQLLFQEIMREFGNAILPYWDRRTHEVKRVLNRLLPACGLEHLDWEVYVVNSPGKF